MRKLALFLALPVIAARADDPTPEAAAADAFLAALRAEDEAELGRLVARDDPDPWLVADELCARGEGEAAAAFARVNGSESLAACVAAQRERPTAPEVRKAVAALSVALRARKWEEALAALDGAPRDLADVPSIRLEFVRGYVLRSVRRLEESVAAYDQAADAAQRLGWVERADLALHEAGLSSMGRSDFAGALRRWERRLRLAEVRGDRTAVGAVLGNIGAVHRRLGDYPEALSCMERSLVILEEEEYRPGIARTLTNLGGVHQVMGHPLEAIACLDRALAIMKELGDRVSAAAITGNVATVYEDLGEYPKALALEEQAYAGLVDLGDPAGAAGVLGNMGVLHMRLGNYAKAIECHHQALAAKERFGNRAGAAMTLDALGLLHARLRDYPKAIAFHERALRLAEETEDRPGIARILGNMGNAQADLGDHRAALASQERALDLRQRLGDPVTVARTLGNIGAIHGELGDREKAISYQERALALFEELRDRPGIANTLDSLAYFHGSARDYGKALPCAERALRVAEEIGSPDLVFAALRSIARIRLARDEAAEAAATARRAVDTMRYLARGLGDEEGASARGGLGAVAEIGTYAAAALGDAGSASFFLESGRAGALLESLRMRATLWASVLPEDLRRAETEARLAEKAAASALFKAIEAGDVAPIAECRRELAAARDRLAEVVARIQREAKASANLMYPDADPLDAIAGRLRDGEALVLYGLFDEESFALVVTKAASRVLHLGGTEKIAAACAALAPHRKDVVPDAAVAALRKLVVEPLGIDAKTTRLLVSPDGALSYVPFALLAPDVAVASVPSGTAYGALLDGAAKRGEGVLALGDPDGDAGPADEADAERGKRGRLPATGKEAKAVGDVVLLGKDASEAGLRAALATRPRWRAVHLACHGFADPERPMMSALALSPAGEDDGLLSALDVFRMRVPADLAVLSACETGRGKFYRAEGIVGLTRAFMFAGAPRVIVSLWKVDDDATQALMTRFYEGWKAGKPAAAALRDAQAFVRSQEKWRHPAYWAAWVLWGLPE